MIKAVFDSNIIVSGLIASSGAPYEVIETWRQGRVTLLISEAIIEEVADVLARPFFRDRRHITQSDIERFVHTMRTEAIVVTPRNRIEIVPDDPDDDRIVECALAGGADYIVSGDHHLLTLRRFRTIQIVSAQDFLANLAHLTVEN